MEIDTPSPAGGLRCRVVSDGRRGIENQALGLAEAVSRLTPLSIDPLHLPRTGAVASPHGAGVDLWIGCGRAAVRAAPVHRRAWPDARFVYVQDPRQNAALFDLIIAPRHDRVRAPNVFEIIGAPNRISPEKLQGGMETFRERLGALPGPRAAILIGGDSKHHRFTDQTCADLLETIKRIRAQAGSVMITPSRRSPAAFRAALAERFAGAGDVWLHDEDGPNPYFAFLGAADWICVTEDSTNMLCEAASTGKPVYRLPVDGEPGKFQRLYAGLEGAGAVRPFLGRLERWTYQALDETHRAAQATVELLGARTTLSER